MENKIGQRILEARNTKGYTQEELAEKIGSVPSYISNIERKNKCPSLA
ncbi:MAG: helix-turn-helix transcriptional regulator [Clostridia bacterium]